MINWIFKLKQRTRLSEMDIVKLTAQHDDTRCDVMQCMPSLDVKTRYTGAHNHCVRLIFKQNQMYDGIDWIFFVELCFCKLRMEHGSR